MIEMHFPEGFSTVVKATQTDNNSGTLFPKVHKICYHEFTARINCLTGLQKCYTTKKT